MALSSKGIKQIALCKKGTLLTSPTNSIVFGLKRSSTLEMKPFNPIKDTNNRSCRNRYEFPFKGETLQPSMKALKDLLTVYLPDGGCDAEFLATPQSSGVDGGCPQFAGDNFMGVKPIYKCTSKEHYLGAELNAALVHSVAKALWDASDSNTPVDFGVTNNGIDFTKQRHPWIEFSDTIFDIAELLNYDFELGAEGETTEETNRFIADWITVKYLARFKAATIPNIVSVMDLIQSPAVSFQQKTGDSTYMKFAFNAGVLSLVPESLKIGDDERTIQMTYEGKFSLSQLAWDFTALTGGAGTGEDGSEGGTLTVSL